MKETTIHFCSVIDSFYELKETNIEAFLFSFLSFSYGFTFEFSIVIMLIKCGNRLGVLGKSIKRFAFNVKKGEEDQLNMQYSFLLRRPQKASFDVTTHTETVT